MKPPISIFWFRRDLRLEDNAALYYALRSGHPVLPVFIFDTNILNELEDKADRRVQFIYQALQHIQQQLGNTGSSLLVLHGTPIDCYKNLVAEYNIQAVYTNQDYEPYATQRDGEIKGYLAENGIPFHAYKDQVIFEKNEVVKANGQPYLVFTPYSRAWKEKLKAFYLKPYPTEKYYKQFFNTGPFKIPSLAELGFTPTDVKFEIPDLAEPVALHYHETRDIPAVEGTTRLSHHLRFGTISIRYLAARCLELNEKLLNELIWREFYQCILWHEPRIVNQSFKREYDAIQWRNNEAEFEKWCTGQTGYPIVDAGMRQLNETGWMHNRVRMITASFLCKHLLIDWRWGEAYFAKKLIDYDLASNNGGWQWCAGTGVDAAPYFRIFNPYLQTEKFDPKGIYIRRWVKELDTFDYPKPMVNHEEARKRCLAVYKAALK
jgi:deoxyribodipyrimidine photo-lyase